jgi:hypothetical protein
VQGRAGFGCGAKHALAEDASRLAVRMEQDAAHHFNGTPVRPEKQPFLDAAMHQIAVLADRFVASLERMGQQRLGGAGPRLGRL